jgi:hypothetical protein
VITSKNQYLKIRDNLFIVLLLTLIIDAACIALSRVQFITDYSFALHEMLSIPLNISIILIPIVLIMLLYNSIKNFKDIWKATILMDLKYKIKIFVCILCMAFTIGLIYYQLNYNETSAVYTITNKIVDGKNTYLMVNNIKLKCTQNEYNLINVNKEYFIVYEWNSINPSIGKLNNIELTEYNKNK